MVLSRHYSLDTIKRLFSVIIIIGYQIGNGSGFTLTSEGREVAFLLVGNHNKDRFSWPSG
jgi:hypothetical protein